MHWNRRISSEVLIWSAGIALVLALPFILQGSPYYFDLAILIMIAVILSLGVRLTLLMGLPTLGHGAFALIGAYVSALLVMKLNVSFWITLPLAGLAAVMIGIPICYPSLMRLRGGYFLLVTIAFVKLLQLVCLRFPSVTGGEEGISGIPKPDAIHLPLIGVIDFSSRFAFYYLVFILTLLAVVFMHRLDRSPFGRLIKATRQSDTLSEGVGVNVAQVRVIAFAIVCFSGGIAGCLFAHNTQYICPEQFGIWPSLYMLLYATFGGIGSVMGPILGTAILKIVPELLVATPVYSVITFGLLLVVVTHFLPDGLIGLGRPILLLTKKLIRR